MQSSTTETSKLKNIFKEFKKTPTEEMLVFIIKKSNQLLDPQLNASTQVSIKTNIETAFKPYYTDNADIIISKFKELLVTIDTLKKNNCRLVKNQQVQLLEWLNDYEDYIRAIYKFPIRFRTVSKERCDEIIQRVQKYHDKFMEKIKTLKNECNKLEGGIQLTHSHWVGIYNQYQADQYCMVNNNPSGMRNFECSLSNLQNTIMNKIKYQSHVIEKILKYQNKMSGFQSAIVSVHWPQNIITNEVENIRRYFEENVIDSYEKLYSQYEENMERLVKLHDDIIRWFEINS